MISKSIRDGQRGPVLAIAWLAAVALTVFPRGEIQIRAMGYGSPPAWRAHFWAIWQIATALALAGVAAIVWPTLRSPKRSVAHCVMIALAAAGTVWLACVTTRSAWKVTQLNRRADALVALGQYAQGALPPNAVLLLNESEKFERNTLMFWSDRTTYAMPTSPAELTARADEIMRNGGQVYLVTDQPPRPLPSIASFRSTRGGQVEQRHLWAWDSDR